MKDNRDPRILGESLLEASEDALGSVYLSALYDLAPVSFEAVPDYPDETTIEKYGCPQDLPSTLPN